MLLEFLNVKSIFVLIFFPEHFVRKAIKLRITSQRRKNIFAHPVLWRATNNVKISHVLINIFCYICIEICRNCMNIYRKINIIKKCHFFFATFFFLYFTGKFWPIFPKTFSEVWLNASKSLYWSSLQILPIFKEIGTFSLNIF